MKLLIALTQITTTQVVQTDADLLASLQQLYEFLSPYNEFVVVLFVLWLFARRGRPKQGDFSLQAQEVLDAKYRSGEISRKTYDKFRQHLSLRPKR